MVSFRASRTGLALLGVLLFTASACAEKERILAGPRENIRPVADGAVATASTVVNASRAIRLPSQSANTTWAQSFGTPAYRTANAALRAAPQRIWSTSIGSGNSRKQRITASPVVAGGLIYTLDSGARVSAVSPSGGLVWSTDLIPSSDEEGQATGGGMAYDNGTLYVSSGFGRLAALDARSGATRWIQKLESTGSGTPLVRDGLVYLVAGDNIAWAINTSDGRVAWQIEASPSITNVLGAPSPVLAGDFVVFGFGSGDIVAAFRRGGLRRWNATVAGQRTGRAIAKIGDVTGGPVVVGNRIYAGNHSGRIVALDVEDGERIWTAREGALGPVWPAGDSIFSVTDQNKLVRINAADGGVIWAVDLPNFVKDKPRRRGRSYANYGPILAGSRIVVASSDGQLRFFSPDNGVMTAAVPVPGGASSAPVVANQTLYVMGGDGELHAFR
ncbi:PQQ-like beta-propeller repeat protein [Sedimentitalea todarodis]|uniref:PQQ-binding-like beta-propeller repeat protein n=1 Tax=Sedimentitalea todarodis TaxID=1631240 RepID=A0ABU3VBR0_9RHOB|nr:PQQ-binding-like beta-propeller repeat protein [Sedimentitalea todarodis]MDU9003604.1 PQQ-binding-like beta-propeller repeat protein [Sedimentitalea todarodis]